MKKLVLVLMALACASLLWSQELNLALFRSLDLLSRAYQQAYPTQSMKAGLVIMELAENSELAKRHQLAKTVEAYLREVVGRSLVYELVDRKNLAAILGEMEMSLTGIVDPAQIVEIGNLSGVRAFLWGDISDSRDRFLINLNVSDAETAAVLASANFEIEQYKLVKIAEELEYSYVAPNGIGLTAHLFWMPYMVSDLYNKAPFLMLDSGLAYRFSRNFMVSAGLLTAPQFTGESYRWDEDIPQLSIQPGLAGNEWLWGGVAERGNMSQLTCNIISDFIRLDAQYTFNFSPKFNIGLSGGLFSAVSNPRMYADIGGPTEGLYFRKLLATKDGTSVDDYYHMPFIDTAMVEYLFEQQFIPGLKAEIRPEFFITPRIALSIRTGFVWMLPLPVREVHASQASWWFYQQGKKTVATSWVPNSTYAPGSGYTSAIQDEGEQKASWLYYGWNPLLRPDGTYWTYNISGVILQFGLSFFF